MLLKVDCEAIQIKKPGYSEVIGSLLTLNEQALSASAMHGLGARGTAAIPEASLWWWRGLIGQSGMWT